jgi:hypothetical protein
MLVPVVAVRETVPRPPKVISETLSNDSGKYRWTQNTLKNPTGMFCNDPGDGGSLMLIEVARMSLRRTAIRGD